MNSLLLLYSINDTVQPPQPAPVKRLPKAPFLIARDVISSISGHEHS